MIVPFGALALSTVGGDRVSTGTAITYVKYFLSVMLEAVAMALAIVVCNSFISAGLPAFTGSYETWAKTLIYLAEMTFSIVLTVGAVKGSQTLVGRALGLG